MTATALDESANTADGSPASVDPARLEALRRYELLRRRYKRTFGAEPPFDLAAVT